MKSMYKVFMTAVAAAFAFAAVTAIAQSSLEIRQDTLQLQSDKAALQRLIKRLNTDEATLKSETASGRMSAVSKDTLEIYRSEQAKKGMKEQVRADQAPSLQMKADKAALRRQLKRLDVAEARLKADKSSGKIAPESKDSEKVFRDQQAIKGMAKDIAADTTGSLQIKSDMTSLQRQILQLESDGATLKSDTASGRMSAVSKDALEIYKAKQATKGEKNIVAAEEGVQLQMTLDKATLQRQLKRLDLAEARLRADKDSGRMAGESKDSIKVSRGQQNIDAEKKQISADQAKLKADQKK